MDTSLLSISPLDDGSGSFGLHERPVSMWSRIIAGAPMLPNPGIGGETLAFVALSLRAATEIAGSV
jgi:hypothetical protein